MRAHGGVPTSLWSFHLCEMQPQAIWTEQIFLEFSVVKFFIEKISRKSLVWVAPCGPRSAYLQTASQFVCPKKLEIDLPRCGHRAKVA